MTKVFQNQIDRIENNEQKVFWGLLTCLVLTLFVYVYCVNSAIFSVVRRETAEQTISTLKAELAMREANYIALKSSVTLSLALAKGFTPVSDAHFVSRDTDSVALSLVKN